MPNFKGFFTFIGMFLIISVVIACTSLPDYSIYPNISQHLDTRVEKYTSFDELLVDYETIVVKTDIETHSENIQDTHSSTPSIIYGSKKYYVMGNDQYKDENGDMWRGIRVTTTAYTWKDDGVDPRNGAGDGKTSIGRDAIRTYGIAAGTPTLPYGTIVHVDGYGTYTIDDTGGAMRRAWRNNSEIILDLRIPQLRYDGVWRSVRTIQNIARQHGRQRNRIVMIKL
jgi:3D (Asp-Asp-Asp) domain-containing protein